MENKFIVEFAREFSDDLEIVIANFPKLMANFPNNRNFANIILTDDNISAFQKQLLAEFVERAEAWQDRFEFVGFRTEADANPPFIAGRGRYYLKAKIKWYGEWPSLRNALQNCYEEGVAGHFEKDQFVKK